MREAGARLMARDLMGRDVFARGRPEGLHRPKASIWQASLYDLLAAYGQVKARNRPVVHIVATRNVMTLDTAIERVARLVGSAIDWTVLESFLPATDDPEMAKSARASSFVAALELAKQRRLDIKQAGPFAPLYLRAVAAGEGAS
jgi:segregation and condensation protein A